MNYNFTPVGICPRNILVDIEPTNNTINEIVFSGGCQGNLSAISKIIKGKKAEEVISLFKGNTCGKKVTSCTDQLALMLESILSGELTADPSDD